MGDALRSSGPRAAVRRSLWELLAAALLVGLGVGASLADDAADDEKEGWVGFRVLDRPDADECEMTSKVGDSLYVEYEVFIDERPQGKNKLEFKLGAAPVAGWDRHLGSMCLDEERELTLPPSTHGHKNIGMTAEMPRDAVLYFRIRLLDINGNQRRAMHEKSKQRKEKARQREVEKRAREEI
eukprot:TRINITY_DN47982_c0_g1_i1.p1 TRINITY_DN47982_c0_g1~~TRINITY_DN47982_c0_g1_i1.p1  ORF type:complete len:193 (+),score=42.15 TRINITY_DN47982_c0_g1_i1:32-580(+)